jgi:methylamine--corrinoid protein Co-methyltransferase
MVGQALARNSRIVTLNDIYVISGPGTKELLYECAAQAIIGTVCGFNMQGAGTTGGFKADAVTGLEARFIAEVSRAAQGLKRQDASALAAELLTRYQATLSCPNRGKSFPEVYDIETVQPKPEWLDMYYDVKEDLTRLGLVMKYAPRPASA